MLDGLAERIEAAMTSPWALLVIFAIVALDAFFPVVPSEPTVITGAVFAASGDLNIVAVIAAGALGAFVGDHVSYGIGRSAGSVAVDRLTRRPRAAAARGRVEQALDRHGGPALVSLRFVIFGRSLSTSIAGALRFPLRRFSPWVALGGLLWALQAGLLGYFAGRILEGNYLLAVGLGIVVSGVLVAAIELTRARLRSRRAGAREVLREPVAAGPRAP